MHWTEYPLIKPTIALILGILSFQVFQLPPWLIISFSVILTFIVIFINYRKASLNNTTLSSIGILGIFLCLGHLTSSVNSIENIHTHFSHSITSKDTLIVSILEDPKIGKSVRVFAEVNQINRRPSDGKLLLYFKKDSLSKTYQAGDIIAVRGNILPVKANTNPKAFDYKNYLSKIHIHHQLYANEGQHQLIKKDQLPFPSKQALAIRRWGTKQLRKALNDENKYAVASALILGDRGNLSEDIYKVYSETGAIHVLAVSGLHVGIITYIFTFLFKFIRSKKPWVKLLKLLLLLTIVWSYALVTGGAPAVMRASLMFSLLLIGQFWFNNWNIYNLLALSALILLIGNPLLIYQVGFQFSYLALISIIFFYQMTYRRLVTSSKTANTIIGLAVVSIAAQILVFPLTIFYFHKLPTYFILSGVFAVSLAPFILGLGLFTLATSSIPFLFKLSSFLLSTLLNFFIGGINIIHNLPLSNISGLWLENYEVAIIYISIIAFMLFIYRKRMHTMAFTILVCTIVILCSSIRRKAINHSIHKLTIYETSKKQTYIELYKNGKSFEYKTAKLTPKDIDFIAGNHRMFYDINEVVDLKISNGLMNFKDKICYFPAMNTSTQIPKYSNYTFITHKYNKPPKYLFKYHTTDFVVMDNSIPFYMIEKWKTYCESNNVSLHIVKEKGSFNL